MLERRQLPLGNQCFTGDPAPIAVVGATGFDIGPAIRAAGYNFRTYAPTPQDLARHPSRHGIVGVMVHATAWPAGRYAAPGL